MSNFSVFSNCIHDYSKTIPTFSGSKTNVELYDKSARLCGKIIVLQNFHGACAMR